MLTRRCFDIRVSVFTLSHSLVVLFRPPSGPKTSERVQVLCNTTISLHVYTEVFSTLDESCSLCVCTVVSNRPHLLESFSVCNSNNVSVSQLCTIIYCCISTTFLGPANFNPIYIPVCTKFSTACINSDQN